MVAGGLAGVQGFWADEGGVFIALGSKFVLSEQMKNQPVYIARRLTWIDTDRNRQEVVDDNLLATLEPPLVILGEPGLGKTRLMEKLGELDDVIYVTARSFLRRSITEYDSAITLVIDGLDEVAAVEEGDPLHNVLKKLLECKKPNFVISCRSAEWQSLTGKLDIADEYNKLPTVLTLEPLSEDDVLAYLTSRFGSEKARIAIYDLKQAGLVELYQNPLTLEFVVAILENDGEIPASKGLLYERAVSQLRLEKNATKLKGSASELSEETALDAAGCMMAAMLLTGCEAVGLSDAHEQVLSLNELDNFKEKHAFSRILKSRLFRASVAHAHSFAPLHRTIAEYLAARWLAKTCQDAENSDRVAGRILGLIRAEGGVPASLRGMHAWLPKFSSSSLGLEVISTDPFGVFRYGDGDGLDLQQARHMINQLRELAKFNPYFRDDWWHKVSFKGLSHAQLHPEIKAIITNPSEPFQLKSVLLEAIVDSPVATDLTGELEGILSDDKLTYHERRVASQALSGAEKSRANLSRVLEDLLKEGGEDATRLALGIVNDLGVTNFDDDTLARVAVFQCGILEKRPKGDRSISLALTYSALSKLPIERLEGFLDHIWRLVSPKIDPDKWWGGSYDSRWSEFSSFVATQLKRHLESNAPTQKAQKLWNWLLMAGREPQRADEERKQIALYLAHSDELRRDIHRLTWLNKLDSDDFLSSYYHCVQLCEGLNMTLADAKLYLGEVVARQNPREERAFKFLANQFRAEGLIPKDIQKFARPYFDTNPELEEFLTRKPKRGKLEEWEVKYRRSRAARKRREVAAKVKSRENYTKNIDSVSSGELGWILGPANSYLCRYADSDRDQLPIERVETWLGAELARAAATGFEAVLQRIDLPSAKEIADSHAESRVWNYIYPMLAGAAQRYLSGKGFSDLPHDLVSGLLLGAEHFLGGYCKQFDGLKEALEAQVASDAGLYEAHLRQKIEPQLAVDRDHISGLYPFVRRENDKDLAGRLCIEWLETFGTLRLATQTELIHGVLFAPADKRDSLTNRLQVIVSDRLREAEQGSEAHKFWLSIYLSIDFATAQALVPAIDIAKKDWLWALTRPFYSRYKDDDPTRPLTIDLLVWIVTTFRTVWPYCDRPSGSSSGDTNPWDASNIIQWAASQIAKDTSDAAILALISLRDMPRDGYSDHIQAAIAAQHRSRLEAAYKSCSIAEFKAALCDEPPKSASDVQAIVVEAFQRLQRKLKGDPLNPVNNFYSDSGSPRIENACRDQALMLLGDLPFGIQYGPEVAMANDKRSDSAFHYSHFLVPLEAKGQWHTDVWDAAERQLVRYYSIHHQAAQKGIYLVFWFGNEKTGKKGLKRPPKGVAIPSTAQELQAVLTARLPIALRSDIAVIVLDVTKSSK